MWNTLVIWTHVVGAIGALSTGGLALFAFPNGSGKHRLLGKLYLVSWGLLAVGGILIGMCRPGISVFEVLNTLGIVSTVIAYNYVLRRKKLGRIWLRQHYQWMLTSLTFVVVATINQMLPRIGISYPIWVFYLMVVIPIPINALLTRMFDRRYGFARPKPQIPVQTS